ncbi:MAG: hypothetical protein LBT22_04125, partial [Peptococcaceae bacterium]|nr:hypothetical protein [Peptococcaceae bacterium]
AKGGRFRFSSRCALLAQRDALGVHASLFAEPPALRLAWLGLGLGELGTGRLWVCFFWSCWGELVKRRLKETPASGFAVEALPVCFIEDLSALYRCPSYR